MATDGYCVLLEGKTMSYTNKFVGEQETS